MTLAHLDPECYWLPVATAARWAGRPRSTVRGWVRDGRVKTRNGRVWLWDVYAEDDRLRRAATPGD